MTPSPDLFVARQRAALPCFILAPPDALAHGRHAQTARTVVFGLAQLRYAALAASLPLEDPTLIQRVQEARALLPPGTVQPGERDAHDAYFHLARTSAPPAQSYLRGLVAALEEFLSECDDDSETSDYGAIGDALIELWLDALGIEAPVRPYRVAVAMKGRAPNPVRRWLRGHHVFAAITQGLIWTLHGFEEASERNDLPAIEAHLTRIARLYHASAAAFRFTADFAPEAYTDIIRPSMCEPYVPAGFSGSMSLDHGALVAHLSRLRQPLSAARALFPQAYADMTGALAQVYDDHRWVCERFAGTKGPSLRTDRLCGDNAAVQMIDRFKARRLDMLG